MKNLLLVLLCTSSFVFGQNKYITSKDFAPNGNDKIKVDKMITTYDGENRNVNTKLFIGKDKLNKSDYLFFNKMIDILLTEAKYTLKNKTSFSAQNIRIYQTNEGWLSSISYSGANSYGGKKDAEYALLFDNDLKYTIKYKSPEL